MPTIYFSLTPHTYAARFDNAIIILDSTNDNYLSFIDTAADYLQFALDSPFTRDQAGKLTPAENEALSRGIRHSQLATPDKNPQEFTCDLEQLNYWVSHFLENNFIQESTQEKRKNIAPLPLQAGGLIEYQWDHKPSWKPFTHTSKIQTIKTFFTLAHVHRTLKRKGIKGILDAIKNTTTQHKNLRLPTEQEINALADAVDAASLLYPKKTFCLAWASTFVLLALRKNWSCNLAIGIQVNPFYAHAWAQVAGNVIHDDPAIAKVLSIILKEPQT